MNTPIYREMDRLFNNNMTVCRNTVYNWFVKGSAHLKKVLHIFKQIQQERQGEKTSRIIQRLRHGLDKLLVDTRGMRGNLMQKALNYLNSFWNQLILYLKDGRYSIDRSSFARLLPAGRKNSLTFGSHAGVEISVIYHTFIQTCKMCGVSTLEYFKQFFKAAIKRVQFRIHSRIVESEQVRLIIKAIMQGRTDYERSALPLATIGTQEHVTDDHRY